METWLGWVRLVPLLVLAHATACDSDPGTTGEAQDTTGGPADQTTETTQRAPPGAEENCDALTDACSNGGVCDDYACGGRAARFNHFGCPRSACESDDDCPSGEACFTVVYDTLCEPADTTCAEVAGACACTASDDCEGTFDAHCLPVEFYPVDGYCDAPAWTCETLGEWALALQGAEDHHRERGNATIADGLSSCVASATTAIAMCE